MPTMRELEAQAKALAPVFKAAIAEATAPLAERLKSLEAERDQLREALSERPDYDAIAETVKAQVIEQLPTPKDGEDGKDADPELVKTLVDEAVSNIEIPQPRDGEDGKDVDPEFIKSLVEEAVAAIEIPEPVKGEDGKDVDPEFIKELVAEAVQAIELPEPVKGKDGADGKDADPEMVKELVREAIESIELPQPRNGQDGRDATQIEILPEINEEKSYPRGSYAKHNGGLFRAYEQTHGMRGWECIVDGVADMTIDQADERTFKATATLSSGKTTEKQLSIPTLIYKGVFSPGEYKEGDAATWAGSLWVCEEDTSDKPGEAGSKGWRLAVKKGRDGKDGINGKDMTKGVSMK